MICKKLNKSFKYYNFIATIACGLLISFYDMFSTKLIYFKRKQDYKKVYNIYKNSDIIVWENNNLSVIII